VRSSSDTPSIAPQGDFDATSREDGVMPWSLEARHDSFYAWIGAEDEPLVEFA